MIEYRQEGRVAVLTINRPEARNAVNGDVARGMEEAIEMCRAYAEILGGTLEIDVRLVDQEEQPA